MIVVQSGLLLHLVAYLCAYLCVQKPCLVWQLWYIVFHHYAR